MEGWKVAEDFDISDLIHFIRLEGLTFYKLCSGFGSAGSKGLNPLHSL